MAFKLRCRAVTPCRDVPFRDRPRCFSNVH
jgi:hypothetical protein